MVQTACALRSRIAAAKRWNNFEGIRLQRFGFGCARAQRFKMFFAATEQRLEFLLGAHDGLGRISLVQTHGPSLHTTPWIYYAETLFWEPRPRAAGCQEYLWRVRRFSRDVMRQQ
jgi:hypothetical protein